MYKCDRYDIKGKQYLDSNAKYYVADIGLRTALLGLKDMDAGHIWKCGLSGVDTQRL